MEQKYKLYEMNFIFYPLSSNYKSLVHKDNFNNLQENKKNEKEVPIWEKTNITLEEAADYTGIGVNKLREISDQKGCSFVLWVGNKRLLKRKRLEDFLNSSFSI